MNLHELAPVMGSTHVNKRKGRGTGTGNGSVTKKVTVKAAAFSESAKEKIEKAGGKAEVV